jgi:hypothetical protein
MTATSNMALELGTGAIDGDGTPIPDVDIVATDVSDPGSPSPESCCDPEADRSVTEEPLPPVESPPRRMHCASVDSCTSSCSPVRTWCSRTTRDAKYVLSRTTASHGIFYSSHSAINRLSELDEPSSWHTLDRMRFAQSRLATCSLSGSMFRVSDLDATTTSHGPRRQLRSESTSAPLLPLLERIASLALLSSPRRPAMTSTLTTTPTAPLGMPEDPPAT